MPDKDGNPVRGELGHWRYNKDNASGNKFDKSGKLIGHGPPIEPPAGEDTTTKTPGLRKVPGGTPDPKGVYTRKVAEGFNREEQKNLLKARGVQIKSRDYEKERVNKILKSNPAEDTKGPAEGEPELPDKEKVYTKSELEDFKTKKLVEILKERGESIPMTEKGKIKKILETQEPPLQ